MFDEQYVAFNGTDLRTLSPYFDIDRRDPNAMPKIELDTETPARGHGSKLLQKNYREKTISVYGHIAAPDRTSLDQALSALKYHLVFTEGNLDIVQEGSVRTWVATLQQFNPTKPAANAGFATLELIFVASDPFGRDVSQTAIDFSSVNNVTAATVDNWVTFGGSWVAQPVIQATINSGTGLTGATITISNPTSGHSISITRDWVAGDVLQIDSANKTVTVNNNVADYTGVFPEFDPVQGLIRYTDTFTTRNVTLTGSYYKRWL